MKQQDKSVAAVAATPTDHVRSVDGGTIALDLDGWRSTRSLGSLSLSNKKRLARQGTNVDANHGAAGGETAKPPADRTELPTVSSGRHAWSMVVPATGKGTFDLTEPAYDQRASCAAIWSSRVVVVY